MDLRNWSLRALSRVVAGTQENEVQVNDSTIHLERVQLPTISNEFFTHISLASSNILIVCIIVAITRKCVQLKLARTAKHAFYSALAQVLCVTESLMVPSRILHVAFGILGFTLGYYAVGNQILLQQRREPQQQQQQQQQLPQQQQQQQLKMQHFRSKHSCFGLVGCLLQLGSLFSGLWLLQRKISQQVRLHVLIVHRLCGLFCFGSMMISLMFSYNTGFVHRNWEQRHICQLKWSTLLAFITAAIYDLYFFVDDLALLIPKQMLEMISSYDRRVTGPPH